VTEELGALQRAAEWILRAAGVGDTSRAIDGLQDENLSRALLMADGATDEGLRRALVGVEYLAKCANLAQLALGEPSPEVRVARYGRPSRAQWDNALLCGALRGSEPGHTGDEPFDQWLRKTAKIYTGWTGRPATGGWDSSKQEAKGFTLFALLAGRPFGLAPHEAAGLRARIQRLKNS
jgi:hypothetical protein